MTNILSLKNLKQPLANRGLWDYLTLCNEAWSFLVGDEGGRGSFRPWIFWPVFLLAFSTRYFFKWAIPDFFFFIFVFSIQLKVNNVQYKCLPMTGFKLRTSGIGSDRSTNWATTTAHTLVLLAYNLCGVQGSNKYSSWSL